MKLIYLLLVFFTFTTLNIFSQITEGFESGLPSSYGTTTSYTLGSGTWTGPANNVMAGTTGVKSGTKSCQLRSQTGAQIVSPTITQTISTITFWASKSTTGTASALQVNYSTDGGTTWIAASGSPFSLNQTVTQFTATINTSSTNVKIQFYRTAAVVYIDDVVINKNNNSICSTVTTLSLPSTVGATTTTGTQSTCGKGNDFPVNSFGSSLYGDGEDAVWEIVVPSGGRNLQFDLGGSGTYKILSLHSACTPTNANSLVFGTTSSGTSTSFSRNLDPGTYYLWTDTWPSPTCGQYSITITRLADPLPPSCISSPTSPTNSSTNQSLTPTLSWSSAANATSYDVYFGTTLPETPTTNTSSTSYNPGTLLEGTTYYWKIVPKNSAGAPTGCSTWSFTTLSRPVNDNPSGAITLTIGTTVSYSTYTNLYATNTTTESTPSCASYSGEDVWFKVTLPQYINSLDFDTQTGVITDGGMAIYRGTPGSLVEIQCDDDSSPNGLMSYISRTDFFEYETIYIRVWEYGGGTTGTFGISVTTPQPLPVELNLFDGFPYPLFNTIKWTTESENNSSHFDLESSFDGFFWKNIISILAAGNSTQEIKYSYIDYNQSPITYYRLQQFDIDGKCKTYGPILVTKTTKSKKIVKYINLMGQEINPNNTSGIIIEIYDDGTMKKMIR
jgi:hypothetical protein